MHSFLFVEGTSRNYTDIIIGFYPPEMYWLVMCFGNVEFSLQHVKRWYWETTTPGRRRRWRRRREEEEEEEGLVVMATNYMQYCPPTVHPLSHRAVVLTEDGRGRGRRVVASET